ncbi:MAG: S-layer homology domain-containing protein [Clostridia bacterium]|nr:S-layer homology domain-containing protein [Clostridia bacterium]
MRNKNRRVLGWLLAAAMLLTVAPGLISPVFADDQPAEAAAEISKSKEVTAWDGTTAEITLSLPGKEETLACDIVFVLDKSTHADTKTTVLEMLSELKEEADANNTKVKVGVVQFNRTAHASEFYDLAEDYDKIEEAFLAEFSGGSNLHAGLLAAKELLESDQTVDKDRKYMILISDGSTYLFCKDGDYSVPYSRGYAPLDVAGRFSYGGFWDEGYYSPSSLQGNVSRPDSPDSALWKEYFADVATRNEESEGDQYDFPWLYYDELWQLDADAAAETYIEQPCVPRSASNRDMAFYYADQAYQELKAICNTYAIGVDDTGAGQGNWDDSKAFMRYLNGEEYVTFDEIQSDILYLLGAGSTVDDMMGEQFDFVNEPEKLKMRVLDAQGAVIETYDAEIIEENHYGFGKTEGNTASEYLYELIYDEEEDQFTWKINVDVTNFQRLQLVYFAVFSGEKETRPGTYGIMDLDGDGKEDRTGISYSVERAIFTNSSAILYPVDSMGEHGDPEEFPMPSVSYTVQGDAGIIDPTNPVYYTLSYESNGGTEYADERYAPGTTVTIDKVPMRPHYIFKGWYADEALSQPVTTVVMDRNRVVYAAWEKTNVPEWLNGMDHDAYIIGYPDGMVHPEANITRAEVATIFFRLLTNEIRDKNLTEINAFSDVKDGMWFNAAVSTMAKLDIVTGYPDGTFRPNDTITRAEFAAIAARFDRETSAGETAFSDILGHWARTEIEKAAYNGWITGYPDGTFRPDRKITRAESMALVNRVLARDPERPEDLLPDMIRWPDNMNTGAWYYLDVQEATNSHDYERETKPTETWTVLRHPRDWTVYEK